MEKCDYCNHRGEDEPAPEKLQLPDGTAVFVCGGDDCALAYATDCEEIKGDLDYHAREDD